MKKICIIVPYDYPVPAVKGGAVETLIQFLIEENEKKQNFLFTVLTIYNKDAEELSKKYKHTKIVFFKDHGWVDDIIYFLFRTIKKIFGIYIPYSIRFCDILKYLKNNKEFDYILFENGNGYMLPLISKVYPKEKILNHLHWYGDGNKKIDNSFGYLLPVSEFVSDEWKKRTGRTSNSIFLWENCINSVEFEKKPNNGKLVKIKEEYLVEEDEKIIIYVGKVNKSKGVKALVKALNEIKNHKIHLFIVGGAEHGLNKTTIFEKNLNSIIAKMSYKISRTGYINNSELYLFYAISDLAVMPSFEDESAGMVGIEAMMTGTPLISTNVGGMPEYMGDGASLMMDISEIEDVEDEGFINIIKNSVQYLLDNDLERKNQALQGYQKSRMYTLEKYYFRFCEIIQKIVNEYDNK